MSVSTECAAALLDLIDTLVLDHWGGSPQLLLANSYFVLLALAARLLMVTAVILLQIVMVNPGTHLVKNHESQLKNNKSEIENVWVFLSPDS